MSTFFNRTAAITYTCKNIEIKIGFHDTCGYGNQQVPMDLLARKSFASSVVINDLQNFALFNRN